MDLIRRQVKAGRITKSVNGGVDFPAQSAFTAADRLVFAAFLARQRCADARARSLHQSRHIHCRPLAPDV